jgi:hypothetical protein
LIAFITSANARELYNCIDRDGSKIVINKPQDGMTKCVLRASYKDPSPEEHAQQKYQIEAQRNIAQENNESDNQLKKKVELERKRLEGKKDRKWLFPGMLERRIKELENDPEQYFYNKAEREAARKQ